MVDNVYRKNQLKEFVDYFNTLSVKDKYSSIVKIASCYYGLEIKGISIEKISFDENIIEIIAPNNHRLELRIVDDLEITI